jgi:hypothetical protein
MCVVMREVRDLVVVVVDSNHLPLTAVGFTGFQRDLILSCEEAIQLVNGTLMVLLTCQFVSEIMHGREPEVFLHQ